MYKRQREETIAESSLGLGSYMPVGGAFVELPQVADARVDTAKGALITTADPTGLNLGLGAGIYHSYDYSFYYFNLRANAVQRVERMLQQR